MNRARSARKGIGKVEAGPRGSNLPGGWNALQYKFMVIVAQLVE